MKMPEAKAGVVPELRFPKFRDAGPWEVKRLGDVYRFKPTNSFPRDRLNYDAGAIRNIHYGDIHKGLRATFRLADENVPFVNSDFAETIREDALCAAGDIVFADASEDVTDIGKAIEIVDTAGERLVAGLHTILASQVEPTLITGFGAYLFASSGIREQIQQRAQGAKVLGISKSQLADIALAYPKHENEQQMIADCLTALDDLIRAEGERLAALKDHKRGLMQRLFPRPDEASPRLRFPEFRDAGPWEVKRLGEIAVRVTDRNSTGRNTRVLTNSAELGVVDQRDFFTKDIAVKENLAGYTLVEMDDFVYNPRISASAPVGPISRNKIASGVMSPLYTVFRFGAGCLDFLEYLFQTNVWHPYLRAVGSSGARHDRLSVSIDDFLSLPVLFPIEGEQQKIADCLTELDDLIRAQGETIAALKTHKRGLMQKLFPREVG